MEVKLIMIIGELQAELTRSQCTKLTKTYELLHIISECDKASIETGVQWRKNNGRFKCTIPHSYSALRQRFIEGKYAFMDILPIVDFIFGYRNVIFINENFLYISEFE